jgi:hypothetical protein
VRRALAVLAVAAALAAAAPAAAARPRVTVIGDSVAASLAYVPAAVRELGAGLDLRLDAKVCRRLVAPSCPYRGTTPATALQTIPRAGSSLGRTVVMNVGYNDAGQFYGRDMDRVMRALRAGRVRSVVWVTLPELRSNYRTIDFVIRAAVRRWPQLRIADWARASRGQPWFASVREVLGSRTPDDVDLVPGQRPQAISIGSSLTFPSSGASRLIRKARMSGCSRSASDTIR